MYACTHCQRDIAATAKDPVIAHGRGYYHYGCFRKVTATLRDASEAKREASRAKRSAAMRAAWEKKRAESAPGAES